MTKDKLKKEAEESAKKFFGKPTDLVDLDNLRIFKNGYFAGAEPREKRIEELEQELTVEKDLHQEEINLHFHAEEYIKSLEKENKILEGCLLAEQEHTQMLEQQIEKMKMCCNCRKWRECGEQLDHISYPCHQHDCDDVCPIWELWERR